MLTPEQREKYLESHGTECPYCQSTEIEAIGPVDMDGSTGTQRIMCIECETEWYDIVALSDILEIK